MAITSFCKNESAQVPLAVIGVFLLLVSVITSINLVRMDVSMAKALIRHSLNMYIESNYRYDTFAYQGYSVNAEPLESWDAIDILPIRMKLNRTLIPPVMLPGENG
jgi:hypothetical protein